MASRAPCRRDVLETIERPLLSRLLSPHAGWLAQHGLDLGLLGAPAPRDADRDAPVRSLYALLSRRDADVPPALAESLRDIDGLASPAGHDALLRAARERALLLTADRAAASHAASLLLDHPDAFASARVVAACEGITRYTELTPVAAHAEPRFDAPDALASALAAELAPWFAERGRTRYIDVLALPDASDVMIEITHGDVPRAQSELDGSLQRASRLARKTKRDHALLDRTTGTLALAACSVGERELFRRAFGKVLLGDADAFAARPLLDLAPVLGPLAPGLGVVAAELLEAQPERRDQVRAVLSSPDGLGAFLATDEGRRLAREARVTKAVLSLRLSGRSRPLRVELGAPASVRLDRRDRAVETTVRAWLAARGIMTPATSSRPARLHAVAG